VDTPPKILLHNLLYVGIANFLGMIICYFIEYTARRDFILVHLYQEEREKVAAVNQKLEKRVKERREVWEARTKAEIEQKNKETEALMREET